MNVALVSACLIAGYVDWTRTTPEIKVLEVRDLVYYHPNFSPVPVDVPAASVVWQFDTWVRGHFPGPSQSIPWHTSLVSQKEGPDPLFPITYGGFMLAPTSEYVVEVILNQYAQFDVILLHGQPIVINLNLTPVEVFCNSFGLQGSVAPADRAERSEHQFIDAEINIYTRAIPGIGK